MFLVAYTAARTKGFCADWKLTVFSKRTSRQNSAFADGPYDYGA